MLLTLSGITISPSQVSPSIKILLTITDGEILRCDSNHGVSLNAHNPILVTLSGIVIDVKQEQPKNVQSPILITPSGIIIEVKPEQFINALFSICVTLLGIVIEVKP